MYELILDVQISQRKRQHFIIDQHNEVRFSANSVAACLDWLYEQGMYEFYSGGPNPQHRYLLRLSVEQDPSSTGHEVT